MFQNFLDSSETNFFPYYCFISKILGPLFHLGALGNCLPCESQGVRVSFHTPRLIPTCSGSLPLATRCCNCWDSNWEVHPVKPQSFTQTQNVIQLHCATHNVVAQQYIPPWRGSILVHRKL